MHRNTWFRILEFVVAGVLLDFIENSIIMRATTGRAMVAGEMGIALLVIVPFAIVTEVVIDQPRFWHRLFGLKGHKFDDMKLDKK